MIGFSQTPQSPIVRTKAYKKYCIDEYPTGTNAIVAVLAYSGYKFYFLVDHSKH